MNVRRSLAGLGLMGAIGIAVVGIGAPAPALAQNPAYMSCRDLWRARNEIYARNGYCF